MNNQNSLSPDLAHLLLQEMTAIRTTLQSLTEESAITTDWIPRAKMMDFFGYGDTQMGTLEKSGDLTVSKIGNRKFYHRASLLQLLQQNIVVG